MDLQKLFEIDQVIFLENTEKQLAIRELVSVLEKKKKINSIPRYYAQVIHRESLENTGIGNHFAIPHARTDSVDSLNFVFGVSPPGIDYNSYDKQAVNYILLCIFPTQLSTEYLYLVSMIAKTFLIKENYQLLEKAGTPSEVHAVLVNLFTKYYISIADKNDSSIENINTLSGVPTSDLDLLIKLDQLYRISTEKSSNEIDNKIISLKTLLDQRSLRYYEKMRAKCLEPFAIVDNNTCSACHMSIDDSELSEIRGRSKIHLCVYCGRFLIQL